MAQSGQANGAACIKDGDCLSSSMCDASAGCTGANLRSACNPVTGLDTVQCYGRCTPFCGVAAVVAETAKFNRGAGPVARCAATASTSACDGASSLRLMVPQGRGSFICRQPQSSALETPTT